MSILDNLGRPVLAPKRPETRELAAVSIRDRWSSYPSEGLTPGRMREILRTADYGWQREQMELFEEMEEKDTHLAAILQTRKMALTGMRWEVQPASEDQADKDIADFVREQFEAISDFQDDLMDLLDAIGKGFSVMEILWKVEGPKVAQKAVVSDLRWIHPKRVSFLNVMTPRILTDDEPTAGVDPAPFQVIFHRYRARSGLETRGGVLRTVALPYLLKNYAWKDWAVFNEVFGMPLRVGKYDVGASKADREALAIALRSLGTDAAAIISTNTQIEFVDGGMKLGGQNIPYHVMIEACNAEMSKAVLGQTLTSDTASGGRSGGSLAMAKVHDEVRQDLVMADAEALSRTLKDQLMRPLVGFNFGWDKPVPTFAMLPEQEEDLLNLSEVYLNLDKIGYPLTEEHISERFGVPLPDADQTLLHQRPANTSTDPAGPAQPGGPTPKTPAAAAEPGKPAKDKAGFKAVLPLRSGELELIPQDKQVIENQQALDDLAAQAMKASGQEVARMLAPVKSLIEAGKSLEEIRDGLFKAYPDMNVAGLSELVYQASMLAYMRGRTV